MTEENKTPEFTVADRRKFTAEGERRSEDAASVDAAPQEPETEAAAAPPPAPANSESESAGAGVATPLPPSAAEQQAQHDAYRATGKHLDPYVADLQGRRPQDFEVTFERFVASLYMTALLQMGMMQEPQAQPQVDLLGARQTIDTLGLIQQKTAGNLSDAERNLLENCLYELRMAFVDVTNALVHPPEGGAPDSVRGGK